MDLYNQGENAFIHGFGEEVKRGLIDPENYDLRSGKAKSRYLSYIDRIAEFKPKEYKTSDFADISRNEVINISVFILKEIFGNIDIDAELIDYFKHMITSESDEILNGAAVTIRTEDGKEFKVTEIATFDKTGSIITIVHEFIHYHCSRINIDFNKKRYYEEILSIYAEKVALVYLTALNIEPNIMRKIEETRLEGIVWHYKVHPVELDLVVKTYHQAKKSANFSDVMFAMNLERDVPWIKSPVTLKNALQFKQNLADSYGIGYLYSESLLKRFLDDKIATEAKVRQVLLGEETLQELLNYFGISAKSPEVYKTVDDKIAVLRLV